VLRAELDKNAYPFSDSGRGEADPAVPNTSERIGNSIAASSSPTDRPATLTERA
jgi:hypothetical protein